MERDTFVYRGFCCVLIPVCVDETFELEDIFQLGHLVTWHSRYNLGEQHRFGRPIDFFKWVGSAESKVYYIPVYLLDHSGLSISTSPFHDPWDSGQVGFIYTTAEEIRKYFQKKALNRRLILKALEIMRKEIDDYDCILRGDVYDVVIQGPGERIPNVFGYDEARRSAERVIDFWYETGAPHLKFLVGEPE